MYKNSLKITSSSLLIALCVSACAPNEAGKVNKTHVGTAGGAVAGALLGSQIGGGSGRMVAVALGALAGGALGHSIGSQLDKADVDAMNKTQYRALEYAKTGQQVSWNNPDSGVHGYVIPTKTYSTHGQNCREYTQTVVIGGKTQQGFGKACRRDDGSWEIVK